MRLSKLLLGLTCTAALAACQTGSNEAPTDSLAQPAPMPATEVSEAVDNAPQTSEADEVRQRLDAVIAGDHRDAADVARDAHRHPLETLSFFGIAPDATVIEITPGGGWYADILAPFLRAHGQYVGAIWDESLPDQPAYYASLNTKLSEKIAASPDVYGDAELRRFNAGAPEFGPAGSADLVLTFRNAHNWVPAGTADRYFAAFYDVLKPGGMLGVVDHSAKTDDPATDGRSGYLTEAQVIELAESAGFTFVDRSDINANPADTTQWEKGVWTLPPSFAEGDDDRGKYEEIGESNRMTLKFVKPATE